MKVNSRKFKNLILAELSALITEQDSDIDTEVSANQPEPTFSSADDQIDSFIIKFENDSIKKEGDVVAVSLDESLSNLSLDALLEQDEAAAQTDEPAPESDEEQVADDLPELEGLPKPEIDIDAFSKRIARLAMNHETLLNIPAVIINRAVDFLRDNYEESDIERLKQILETEYDFEIDGKEKETQIPYAVGAWAGGTGAGGA